MEDLFSEVKKIYPNLEYIRKRDNTVEFGIMTCYGNIHWFSFRQLPVNAEKYVNSWLKFNENGA